MKKCTIDGCGNKLLARGMCKLHYSRWRNNGDPLKVKQVQYHGVTLAERFWARVDTSSSGCWEWSGTRDPNGYGRIRVNEVPMLAHRLSWAIANGKDLTPDQHILHRCDNPSCVKPSHLTMGDHAANMADKMTKGRHVYGVSKGVAHGMAKLTEEIVLAIRASSEKGVTLATRYGVSPTQISDIRNRRVWKHIE